jgi:hypothetical protein
MLAAALIISFLFTVFAALFTYLLYMPLLYMSQVGYKPESNLAFGRLLPGIQFQWRLQAMGTTGGQQQLLQYC